MLSNILYCRNNNTYGKHGTINMQKKEFKRISNLTTKIATR